MALIRDIFELPEQVHRGDFVLRLAEGVQHPTETLRDYVVTPQLVACFDSALGLIRSALDGRTSRASYLHGSFGSGKSHFMAVLHLLLQQNPHARGIPELAGVVAKHDAWLSGRRFLLVPYHMIGAHSMESALLGHYAAHVRALHPTAPVPGVFLSEGLLSDAAGLRASLGDAAFFARLNQGATGGGGWGQYEAAWSAESYDAAVAAGPASDARARLVGALVQSIFTSYRDVAAAQGEAFVPLDQGLSIVSRHAQALGYDAVVLFLDELILWLASQSADLAFVNREGQKLAKLVEAQASERPVPLVSFVARQRDLRELVGEHVAGAQRLGFADVLKYWEARFHTITLEDRNLPAIAERRVLRPRSEAARQQLDQAFRETARVREDVMSVLLTSGADRDMFRQVYPFSPALVQALVAVSALLQRERTALKVMLSMLVEQRDRLKLGDVVPVGDLFDAIADGAEAFTEDMRRNFDNAKKLYHQKLRPLLEAQHELRAEDAATAAEDDAAATAFRADDRLVKTLLLAALTPEVEALRALTAGRLAALNHGTILSPIPGREISIVLERCRRWAAQVGEIRVGEGTNPTIDVLIKGVDTEAILDKAQSIDNQANRLRAVRALLFEALGVREEDRQWTQHAFSWRGTLRECELLFANVRELTNESFKSEDGWRIIIDYPFDADGFTPRDDRARVEQFQRAHTDQRAQTLVWLPCFFTPATLRDLGTYTRLEHVLAGERFEEFASHLSAVDRAQARGLLDNQRSQLRQRLRACLAGAYGVATPSPGSVDTSAFAGPADQFMSLDGSFAPQPPVGADLSQALANLLEQVFTHRYPAHPLFETEVRSALLRKVSEELQRAAQAENGRIVVEAAQRGPLRQVAVPLQLGVMGENAFVLGHHWSGHFSRKLAERGATTESVGLLRGFFDEPRPMGLPPSVQNLVILSYADQTQRSFYRHGAAIEPTLDALPDDLELREQMLPSPEQWQRASDRAGAIFGSTASPLRNASNVARLCDDVRARAREQRDAASRLPGRLRASGVADDAPRLRTAIAAQALLETLLAPQAENAVQVLCAFEAPPSSDPALGRSLRSAAEVEAVLQATNWELLEALRAIHDERTTAAEALRARVAEALRHDELSQPLGPALRAAQSDALRLIVPSPPPSPSSPSFAPTPVPVERGQAQGLGAAEAQERVQVLLRRLRDDPALRLTLTWELHKPRG
jgi:hypothetical protein